MRMIIYISIILLMCSCKEENSGVGVEMDIESRSLVKTTYCLLDLLEGDPSSGGCWTLISVPAGSTITQSDLVGDNPCIVFDNEPCPQDYVFEYNALCDGCDGCIDPATLTICLTCDPPICNVNITAICN